MHRLLTIFGILIASATTFANPAIAAEPVSSGTAFAVTDDGWLLTNAHVVKKCTRIEVKGVGDSEAVKIDEINDLAALKVSPAGRINFLVLRRDRIRIAEDILAIGYPLNGLLSDSIKVTTGNVNALAGIGNDTRYIQISTPIQPGNSGGPVVDRSGMVIGITTATLSSHVADKIGVTPQNVNFAVRASVAELFLQANGIAYQQGETTSAAPPSAADLAEKIAPSVFPVVCHGELETHVAAASSAPPVSDTTVRPSTSYWNHNGSIMEMRVIPLSDSESTVTIAYKDPKKSLHPLGVQPGTVMFEGIARSGAITGNARLFSATCGQISYPVSGNFTDEKLEFSLSGSWPKRNESCRVVRWVSTGSNVKLPFLPQSE